MSPKNPPGVKATQVPPEATPPESVREIHGYSARRWDSVEALGKNLEHLNYGDRTIHWVVLHHTEAPDHAQWKGWTHIESMLEFWLKRQSDSGWSHPVGGHFVVAPDGQIWCPFGDLAIPLNASSDQDANRHGIAIETVGNFDIGHDVLEGAQRHAMVGLTAYLVHRFSLSRDDIKFHRDYPAAQKSCPGSGLQRAPIQDAVQAALPWAINHLIAMRATQ